MKELVNYFINVDIAQFAGALSLATSFTILTMYFKFQRKISRTYDLMWSALIMAEQVLSQFKKSDNCLGECNLSVILTLENLINETLNNVQFGKRSGTDRKEKDCTVEPNATDKGSV